MRARADQHPGSHTHKPGCERKCAAHEHKAHLFLSLASPGRRFGRRDDDHDDDDDGRASEQRLTSQRCAPKAEEEAGLKISFCAPLATASILLDCARASKSWSSYSRRRRRLHYELIMMARRQVAINLPPPPRPPSGEHARACELAARSAAAALGRAFAASARPAGAIVQAPQSPWAWPARAAPVDNRRRRQ